jgi:hypothetical protein
MNRSALITLVLALTTSMSASAHAQSTERVEQTQLTPSYQIRLEIGPASPTAVVETAAGTPMVELMLSHTRASFSSAATEDQGLPVNRHLEIYLADAQTGRISMEVGPTVQIRNQATGEERVLTSVPMYEADEGLGDWHYGNNVYLPAGRYTVTAIVDGEWAVFSDVPLGQE